MPFGKVDLTPIKGPNENGLFDAASIIFDVCRTVTVRAALALPHTTGETEAM
jgi:hypothetical protein